MGAGRVCRLRLLLLHLVFVPGLGLGFFAAALPRTCFRYFLNGVL